MRPDHCVDPSCSRAVKDPESSTAASGPPLRQESERQLEGEPPPADAHAAAVAETSTIASRPTLDFITVYATSTEVKPTNVFAILLRRLAVDPRP